MSANWVCPDHGVSKWVPPGTSKKTGKAYQGFYVCGAEGCEQRPPKAAPKPGGQGAPTSASQGKPERSSDGGQKMTSERTLKLLGALDAASRTFQGTAQGDDMLELAERIFRLSLTEFAGSPKSGMRDATGLPYDDPSDPGPEF